MILLPPPSCSEVVNCWGFVVWKPCSAWGGGKGNIMPSFSLTLFSEPKNTIWEVRSPSRAIVWVYRPRPGCLSLWSFYCLPIDGVLSQSPFVVEITSSTESSHFLALMSATKCYSGVTKRFRSQKANQSNSKCHCFFFFFLFLLLFPKKSPAQGIPRKPYSWFLQKWGGPHCEPYMGCRGFHLPWGEIQLLALHAEAARQWAEPRAVESWLPCWDWWTLRAMGTLRASPGFQLGNVQRKWKHSSSQLSLFSCEPLWAPWRLF